MSDRDTLTPREEEEVLAAEYALGLLGGPDHDRASSRMQSDAGFAAMVRGWQTRLAALAEALEPVAPAARVKQRIDRALSVPDARSTGLPGGSLARLRLWLAAGVAVAAVAVGVLLLPQDRVLAPDRAAELVLPDGSARLRAAVSLEGRSIVVSLAQGSLPTAGDVELWWIAPGAAPVSLGLAPRSGEVRRALPPALADAGGEGVVIAASAEPAGGSTTGAPTGPVVATAPLTIL